MTNQVAQSDGNRIQPIPRASTGGMTRRRFACIRSMVILALLAAAVSILYLRVNVNPKYFDFVIRLRLPKLLVMLVTGFAIGGATIVFQSIINNTIVTPCLLGMNSLYTLVHTVLVFILGTASVVFTNRNIAFAVDLGIMSITAVVLYGWLFKKTKYNVLYVLLIGTVLTSLFGSVQSTLTRVMDPNEYDALLSRLVASFTNVNGDIIILSLVMMGIVTFLLRREIALLNVIVLGKDQAINLGVDYDRTIRKLLLGVSVFIAIATAMVGPISFLGLILANLSRQLFRTYRHSFLITGSALIGMIVVIGGQLIVEHVFVYSVPVSVFISVAGGVYFLYLLLGKRG